MSIISTQDIQEAMRELLQAWKRRRETDFQTQELPKLLTPGDCIRELTALTEDKDLFPPEDED